MLKRLSPIALDVTKFEVYYNRMYFIEENIKNKCCLHTDFQICPSILLIHYFRLRTTLSFRFI